MKHKITFKKFWKHLFRIIRHKHYVFKWCCKCGMPIRGLLHDLSKFSPVEFLESVKYFSETESPINVSKAINGYSTAWQHHKGRNPHHYEYWIDALDYGGKPIQMPKKYAYEMICDYIGAGQAYDPKNWSFEKEFEWWNKRKETCQEMAMHRCTSCFVTLVLMRLAKGNIKFNKNLLDVCWDQCEHSKNTGLIIV